MSVSSFHETRWTLVQRAQGRGEPAQAALSELCAIYYDPVLRFLRSRCASEDAARELSHGFFAELLGREQWGAADPAKGRFRSYLLAAVKHFLARQREKEGAAKRGGQAVQVELGEADGEGVMDDEDFDRAWALALIARALAELAAEMAEAGKSKQFETLRPWLDGGVTGDAAVAARELGLSATALKVAIHRLRERFRQRVRDEIAATTVDAAESDAEFRHLVAVWVKHAPLRRDDLTT